MSRSICMACAVAFCGSVLAEMSIISGEVSIDFDSKFLTYGLVDNNDPILTPAASLMFFDWVSVGVESIIDLSHYGKDAGFGDRAWKYEEIDPGFAITHAFGPNEASWLPTTVAFGLCYMYEAHPRELDDDTQFFAAEIEFPDLWLEPVFAYELDLERDHGTYLNLEFGHTFTLIDPQEELGEDVLDFSLSVAQGWGDRRRIGGYLKDLDHAGLMDACIKGEFTWLIIDGVKLGAYVAYTDFLFDSSVRESARSYEATGSWDKSWNFTTGLSLAVIF